MIYKKHLKLPKNLKTGDFCKIIYHNCEKEYIIAKCKYIEDNIYEFVVIRDFDKTDTKLSEGHTFNCYEGEERRFNIVKIKKSEAFFDLI